MTRTRRAGVLKGMRVQDAHDTIAMRQIDQLDIRYLPGQTIAHVGDPHQFTINSEGSGLRYQGAAELVIIQENEGGTPRTLSGGRMGCRESLLGPQGHVFGK